MPPKPVPCLSDSLFESVGALGPLPEPGASAGGGGGLAGRRPALDRVEKVLTASKRLDTKLGLDTKPGHDAPSGRPGYGVPRGRATATAIASEARWLIEIVISTPRSSALRRASACN